MRPQKRIFYAVLNWGLGHASRSIPVINELRNQNCRVILGADGRAGLLLQKEFPKLDYIELPPYNIHYSGNFVWSMGLQLPKILSAIWKEKREMDKLVQQWKFDAIISDNRYGCFHKNCPSAFMTHQLNIRLPFPAGGFLASKAAAVFIRNFDECWIPDFPGNPNLSGELGHGANTKGVIYIGALSRMQASETKEIYNAVAVLSGPEPERSRLEAILRSQFKETSGSFALVQGITDTREQATHDKNIKIFPYLLSTELNELMLAAKVIICRSGYSSLMDLSRLGKKAVLIPTPGQTEQEYLAQRLFEKGIFYTKSQKHFNLQAALREYKAFPGFKESLHAGNLLENAVQKLLEKL